MVSLSACAVIFYGETRTMLVLSRKKNESIVIDENIVITVVEVRGDKVRLGIQAPKEIPIHRSEVHAAIQNEQAVAAEEAATAKPFPAKG
jgi:carbon storage regulator